jgi:hypothetical protein
MARKDMPAPHGHDPDDARVHATPGELYTGPLSPSLQRATMVQYTKPNQSTTVFDQTPQGSDGRPTSPPRRGFRIKSGSGGTCRYCGYRPVIPGSLCPQCHKMVPLVQNPWRVATFGLVAIVVVLVVSMGVVLAGRHQRPNTTFQQAIGTPPSTATRISTPTGMPTAISNTAVPAPAPTIAPTNTPIRPTATRVPLPSINFANGFTAPSQMILNGTAAFTGTHLRLTNSLQSEHASAYDKTQMNVQSFTSTFTYQAIQAKADGTTFVLQRQGPHALGGAGGGLGYAGIGESVAIKFDLYATHANTTGLLVDGNPPMEQIQLTHVTLTSGDQIAVTIRYNGSVLSVTETDTKTKATDSQSYPIDIPTTIGGTTAYAGFTGATGASISTQSILNWTYKS